MLKYILKRVGQTLIVIAIVVVAVFFLTSMLPGDPVYMIAGDQALTPEEYDNIYRRLLLDRPVVERFFLWLGNFCKGDFGMSYLYNMPVKDVIFSRVGITVYFSGVALILSMIFGVLIGVVCAVKRGSWVDSVLTLIANVASCLPQFWIGLILLYIFCIKNQILPSLGFGWPSQVGLAQHLKTSIMPIVCLSFGSIASYVRQTRSSMLEVIKQDFVRTARSKGVAEKRVIFGHVLKNGLIPIVTITGNRLAMLLGGSMFVETVFNIPGLGMLMMKSVTGRDVPTIQAMVILLTLVSCLAYVLTDVLYVVVDPRISIVSRNE